MTEQNTPNAVDGLLQHLLDLTDRSQTVLRVEPARDDSIAQCDEPLEPPRNGISKIVYRGYKALAHYEISLQHVNILTGANNAGKSTAISALRILSAGIGVASRKKPQMVSTPEGLQLGYVVPTKHLDISLENVHTDLDDRDSSVTFSYNSGGELVLWFPRDGGCTLSIGENSETLPKAPSSFRKAFGAKVVQVPVLGPLEYGEPLLKVETVRAGVMTHRACRHFRNYWYHYPDNFDRFASLVSETWPGTTIGRPELDFGDDGARLHMFCEENRRSRELYWAGFGFQIWCQLLTHVCRATPDDILVVDEPETYLHPTVQRRLVEVVRDTGAQVILATHAPSIVMAAHNHDVIVIDKSNRIARRRRGRAAALAAQLGIGTSAQEC